MEKPAAPAAAGYGIVLAVLSSRGSGPVGRVRLTTATPGRIPNSHHSRWIDGQILPGQGHWALYRGSKHAAEMLSHIASVRAAIARSPAARQGVQHDQSAIAGNAEIKNSSLTLPLRRPIAGRVVARACCDPDDLIRTVEPAADVEEQQSKMPGGSGFPGDAVCPAGERLSRHQLGRLVGEFRGRLGNEVRVADRRAVFRSTRRFAATRRHPHRSIRSDASDRRGCNRRHDA